MNAILWLLRTGCQWRNLPDEYPHWQAVYYYFNQWKTDQTLRDINQKLNKLDREREGREAYPSVFCIDSQSVKLAPMICEHRGIDAHKKVNGRKRQLVVDTGGRLWMATVHAANEGDGPACVPLAEPIYDLSERLEKVFGDGAYAGMFAKSLAEWDIKFERGSRPESAKGFVPVAKPHRRTGWVVERTIAWTNFFPVRRCGRLVKDYEYTVSSSVGWLFLGNIQIMLQQLDPIDQR
jgi:transposase